MQERSAGEQSGGGGASYAEGRGQAGEGCGQAGALLWGMWGGSAP